MAKSKILILAAIFLLTGFLLEADAQTKRRKSTSPRRKARVVRPAPPIVTLEPEVVSRAEDELSAEQQQTGIDPNLPSNGQNSQPSARQPSRTSQRVNELNQQVTTLTDKINSLEKQQRGLLELEQLSRAEDRAEALRQQLDDTFAKESDLRSRIEQINLQMQPEAIERETATIGSLRPEQVRESYRKRYENEKMRANEQLNKLLETRARLEAALLNADNLVQRLRARVAELNVTENPETKNVSRDSQNAPPQEEINEENEVPQ